MKIPQLPTNPRVWRFAIGFQDLWICVASASRIVACSVWLGAWVLVGCFLVLWPAQLPGYTLWGFRGYETVSPEFSLMVQL